MQPKTPLTVSMISGAEGHRIARALASVADWAEEIVVVLNEEVTDETEAIARRYGARIYREPWKGHVAQKNSAASKATQPWVLGLDCDEVISPELRREIEQVIAREQIEPRHAGFSVPRLTQCCGRWMRHGEWYPDRKPRLWRNGSGRWTGIDPHDHLKVEGRVGELKADLLHHQIDNIDDLLEMLVPYSRDFVRHRQSTHRPATFWDFAVRPWWRFFRGYFLRLGFLDGWQGYYLAWFNAFSCVNRYAKVREQIKPALAHEPIPAVTPEVISPGKIAG